MDKERSAFGQAWERLLAGNIDDENSEAYARYRDADGNIQEKRNSDAEIAEMRKPAAKEAPKVSVVKMEMTETPDPMADALAEEAKGKTSWEAQNAEDLKVFSEAFNAPEAPEAAKPETFAQAWKKARAAGLKTFDWAGKPGTKFSTENKEEKAAREALAASKTTASKPTPQQIEAKVKTKGASSNAKDRPSVYHDNFIKDAINKVKEKLSDDVQVGKAKFHANGRPNLTAR